MSRLALCTSTSSRKKVVQCRRCRSTDVIANLRTHAGRLFPSLVTVSLPPLAHSLPPEQSERMYFQWPQKHVHVAQL